MARARKTPPNTKRTSTAYTLYPDQPASMTASVTIGDELVHFRAEAGTVTISADEREPTARVFVVSYTRLDGPDGDPLPASERPITFSFNGGPGSSSVWLHLGLFGPYRVSYGDEKGNPPPPPYGLIDNPESLLDVSDFVFIDPVSTGFSRTEKGQSPKQYHGVEGDIESVGAVIQQYLSRHNRWTSPKFIAGESYGTTRAAGLGDHLWDRHGIGLSGIILISTVLDFQTIRFGNGNDLPHILFLPNFAASAQYHGMLADDLQAMAVEDLLEEVHEFTTSDYATYLLRGSEASPELRASVLARLARYTGLSEAYLEDVNLRPTMQGFGKQLLRDRGLHVGRFDSRFLGRDWQGAGEASSYDPSYATILGNYTAGLNELVRERIGYKTDLPYNILTSRVRPWSYQPAGNNRYLALSGRLWNVMTKQPQLHVYNAAGYYDLATPSAAVRYTLGRVFTDPDMRSRIHEYGYPAGHMMYVHGPSLRQQRLDLLEFYEGLLGRVTIACPTVWGILLAGHKIYTFFFPNTLHKP